MTKEEKMEFYTLMFLVWASRIIPAVAAFGAVIFLIVLLATRANWESVQIQLQMNIKKRIKSWRICISFNINFIKYCRCFYVLY